MRLSIRTRALAFGAAALLALSVPGVAHAAPGNDDFDTALDVTALPFTATVDTTGATKAADDPNACNYWGTGSVWLRYTAPADGFVRLATHSERYGPFYGVFTGERGALTPVEGACTANGPRDDTFAVKAGTTYHVMVVEYYSGGGPVLIDFRGVPGLSNDNRANAAAVAVPSRHDVDLRRTTAEPGELSASCDPAATQSVWYRYAPTSSRFVQVLASEGAVSVYRAADLSEVDCVSTDDNERNGMRSVFSAEAGESYLVRVAETPADAEPAFVEFSTAAPLRPWLSPYPNNPTIYTDVEFVPSAGEQRPLVSGTVYFGDGGSAPIVPGERIRHRYAKDGDYSVSVTATTSDGRTGSSVPEKLTVETHDLAITALSVPEAARAGQTKTIKAYVANPHHDGNVKVTLYKVSANGAQGQEIGYTLQRVAASPTARTEFVFAYTYSAADAAAGQVTFRAVASSPDWYQDARPADNQAQATTTTVRPGTTARVS
ncbi:PKD domain-containing protein [Lentzea chajnantorensis]